MSRPDGLSYTRTHEWVRVEGDVAVIGITNHAQEELGDVALIQLPEIGRMLQVEEPFGEIESIKAVSDLCSPISGEVISTNDTLETAPEQVNNDPYREGWLIKVHMSNPSELSELLASDQYDALVEEL